MRRPRGRHASTVTTDASLEQYETVVDVFEGLQSVGLGLADGAAPAG